MTPKAHYLARQASPSTLEKAACDLSEMFFAPAFQAQRDVIMDAKKRIKFMLREKRVKKLKG